MNGNEKINGLNELCSIQFYYLKNISSTCGIRCFTYTLREKLFIIRLISLEIGLLQSLCFYIYIYIMEKL